jgi:hypothetical protein
MKLHPPKIEARAWHEIAVAIRAYVDWPARKSWPKPNDIGPWSFYLFFDCETRTDQSQRLRVGSYIWCQGSYEAEKGFFYDPDTLDIGEVETLFRYASAHGYTVCTKDEFVSEILYGMAYALGARIVGFNITFDIARLAQPNPAPAKGRMKGGFSLRLRSEKYIPRIRFRQIDRRMSFIDFAGINRGRTNRAMRKKAKKSAPPRRGYFVDIKTLAGALLSGHFSLDSLAKTLGLEACKLKTEEHGRRLSPRYLEYAMRDVEVTAQCFWKLKARFDQLGLSTVTLESAYSEATVGKAHFKQMGIKPFLEVQPDFPKDLLGIALSSFFGGRSEVHIRRQISQIAYCDFLSMYPTVFGLMGLFRWVVAKGVFWTDATQDTRNFLASLDAERMLAKPTWPKLTVLCRVELDDDIFPVRAPYGDPQEDIDNNTIGLNRAKSDCPFWYTLADCAVSTILNGKPPRIVEAIRFSPRELQDGLKPLCLLQNPQYFIDPAKHDFFKRVIEMRTAAKRMKGTAGDDQKRELAAEEQFLKILANSTGYGIFAQFISDTLPTKQSAVCYGPAGVGHVIKTSKHERPGEYFHPLLATFITGAARLMLALSERLAIDSGLDWAFCDTDSMAFVKPDGMDNSEFFGCVGAIVERFAQLNPYDFGGSILKMEDENYKEIDGAKVLHPLFVLPISAKRYAAFNIENGLPVIRKASTHGVGQFVSPYKDEEAPTTIPAPQCKLKGVDRWEHDLWWILAKAAIDGDIDKADLNQLPGFSKPAARQYSASSYDRLQWFANYNAALPPEEQVGPTNFLLTFQMRPHQETRPVRLVERSRKWRTKRKDIRPVAPYDRDPAKAAKKAFDRETGEPVSSRDLLAYAEVFADYARHAEAKFLNGGAREKGITERRCVYIRARNIVHIGKESNEYDDEPVDPGMGALTADFGGVPDEVLEQHILSETCDAFGVGNLADQAGVARQTVWTMRTGKAKTSRNTKRKLRQASRALRDERQLADAEIAQRVRAMIDGGVVTLRELARTMNVDAANLAKALAGHRRLSIRIRITLETMLADCK